MICAYQKYRRYYDRTARAQPLKLHNFCFLLDHRLTGHDMFVKKNQAKWRPMYRVEQVLTNMNFIVRKTGTNHTQCVHRIRLRPIVPQYVVPDLEVIDPEKFIPDPMLKRQLAEPALFDDYLPELVYREEELDETAQEPPMVLSTPFMTAALGPGFQQPAVPMVTTTGCPSSSAGGSAASRSIS